MGRFNRARDVVFGSIVSGRPADLPGVEEIVGLFINAIPLRVRWDEGASFADVLRNVSELMLESLPHHQARLADIQAETTLGRDLFDHLFVFENYPAEAGAHDLAEGSGSRVALGRVHDRTHYPLTVIVIPGERPVIRFAYDGVRMSAGQAGRLLTSYAALLESIAAEETAGGAEAGAAAGTEAGATAGSAGGAARVATPVSALSLLDAGTRRAVVEVLAGAASEDGEAGNRVEAGTASGARDGIEDRDVVEVIEERVRTHGDRIAVAWGDEEMTYGALDAAANRVAARLIQVCGVRPGDVVAIAAEPTGAFLAGLLGILKAGAAYLPIAASLPAERIRALTSGAGAVAAVVDTESLNGFEVPVVSLEAITTGPDPGSPGIRIAGDHPFYVIYTSGSSGRPKGAIVTRANVARIHGWYRDFNGMDVSTRSFAVGATIFDQSQKNYFATLMAGGTVLLAGTSLFDPERAVETIHRRGATLLNCTPTMFETILEVAAANGYRSIESLTRVHIGGEAMRPGALRDWFFSGRFHGRFFNSYGPTECTDTTATWEVTAADFDAPRSVPIGRPVPGTTMRILDAGLQPLPVGVPGEIVIGGACVGAGYIGDEARTREVFLPDPLACGPGARVYRTGDLGRWWPDGAVEFLGRIDQQIKVRGFRIEPGEIEARLRELPSVSDAVVVAVRRPGGDELVAYVVANDHPCASVAADASVQPNASVAANVLGASDELAWRDHLARSLPEYMVPTRFIVIESLPLTPSGKLDRRALPDPALSSGLHSAPADGSLEERAMPRAGREADVARIWEDVLGVKPGRLDNFFHLGGHSLKAVQAVSRIHREMGVRLSLRDFLDRPTVAALAAFLGASSHTAYRGIEPAPRRETYALSHAQHRLWLQHQMEGGASAYNMPFAFRLVDPQFDRELLARALEALVDRHEALRTAFVVVDGEPRQKILDAADVSVSDVDLIGEADPEAAARAIAEEEAERPFDLANPPLLRLSVLSLPDSIVLLLVIHHIVGDGWSVAVLGHEVAALYDAFRAGRPSPLAPLRIQYKDYAEWQNGLDFATLEAYWTRRLEALPERIALPADYVGIGDHFRGGVVRASLDVATTRGLRALAAKRGMTLAAVVLALFKLVLHRLSGQDDLCVGMALANRDDADVERLIGFFVNVLPIRTRVTDAMELDELLAAVADATAEALDHREYPLDLLVRKLNPASASRRQPLFNVVYAFQNFTDVRFEGRAPVVAGSDHGIEPFEFTFGTSKFDLTLFVTEQNDTLLLHAEYDAAILAPTSVSRLLGILDRFARIAAGVAG